MDSTPIILDTAAFARAMEMSHTSFLRKYAAELPDLGAQGVGSVRKPDDGRPYWFEATVAQWMAERDRTYDRRLALRH